MKKYWVIKYKIFSTDDDTFLFIKTYLFKKYCNEKNLKTLLIEK